MAFIRTIEEDRATGDLAAEYRRARRRAGKVFNVIRLQSRRPAVLRRSTALYLGIMTGESALSRAERELLAVVVSEVNACHY
jgi:uncharacterized peroxidase-related enzyme